MDFLALLAQAPTGGAQSGGIGSILGNPLFMMLPLLLILYFMMIRPQQKRMKQHQAMLAEIKRGDKIVTSGGVHGTVYEVSDKTVMVEVWKNTVLTLDKGAITTVVSETAELVKE